MESTQRMGNQGFIWFFGVVECANDVEKLGRVKVRVLGDHTQDLDLIPTEDLPWAMPMMPVNSASISGIGDAPVGLVKGSWVIGFYRDGEEKQQPIIIGSIGGIPIDAPDPAIGYNDPQECFPQIDKLEEPDTNRLARGIEGKYVKEHDAVTVRKSIILTGVASATTTWSEPITPYAAVYPYNKVWEGPYNPECDACKWGHLEEWDSTPGAERYFRQHKTSQNFLEIHPDGTEVRKIYGEGFEINLNTKNILVDGDYRVTVNGNKDERIKGDYFQVIEGNFCQVVKGNRLTHVLTDGSDTVGGKRLHRTAGDSYEVTAAGYYVEANTGINLITADSIKGVAVNEIVFGLGSVGSVTVTPISGAGVDSPSYTSIALSCEAANSSKSSIAGTMFSSIPAASVSSNGNPTTTQVKIIPNKIYHDAQDIINTGHTVAPSMATPSDTVETSNINTLNSYVCNAGSVFTPLLYTAAAAITVANIGTVVTVPAVYTGPYPGPVTVEEIEIPEFSPVTVSVSMPAASAAKTVKTPSPIEPGDIHPECE